MRKSLVVIVAVSMALALTVVPAAGAGLASGSGSNAAALSAQESPTCEYPFEGTDATGEQVTVEEEPDSVVALTPADAQIMFEIGAEGKVDGMPVSQYTSYLEADEELDITEDDGLTPVVEEIVDRDPDVVLAGNTLEDDPVVDKLRDAGLTVYVFPTEQSLDGVAENVRLAGEIVGECEGAEDSLERMNERLEIIEEATADEDRPLALYAMGGGYTAGEATFQEEILTTAGVENLGTRAGVQEWGTISEEVVVEEDPEWIIYPDRTDEPPVGEAVMGTTAYENEQFVAVDDNYMSQPGPLVVEAIEEIVQEVHPEAYAEAEAELEGEAGTNDENDTENDTESDDEDEEATAEGDTIPGFGAPVAVAVLALLAVVGAARSARGA